MIRKIITYLEHHPVQLSCLNGVVSGTISGLIVGLILHSVIK